ncbi:MAG: hypothetical protein AUK47_22170 [Deltaproteobacteria bacterium CG2_30_63_29]|nr:MAG: hypothetical protein AUK47_22170 [Deltaproteobacteria bacterium CG2_30_63_29]PJB46915.1 MAG: hypothetical protein CO108_04930 [Deltaproteobacteria bacterium CG_4_9_14_3_um_filter_63_12]
MSTPNTPKVVTTGDSLTLEWAFTATGKYPAEDFINGLPTGFESERIGLFRLFEKLASTGIIRNKELFKKVEGTQLFEFKRGQLRVLCAYNPQRRGTMFLLAGEIKKTGKLSPSTITRAQDVLDHMVSLEEAETKP